MRFIADGWSVKEIHRLIVLSATYQQSSASAECGVRSAESKDIPHSALRIPHSEDPDNKFLWRFPLRRLEAEEIRDSLLAVSGRLDRTAGGPSITHVKNREFFFDHTSKDGTKYDSRRRSLYLPVVRNNLYDVFQLFDTTDATVSKGDRATTTVATQALFYLNSDLVADSAGDLAKQLSAEMDDRSKVNRLYRIAYSRPASDREVDRALNAVAGFESELADREPDAAKRRARAWSLVCQAVMAANEFVYVE